MTKTDPAKVPSRARVASCQGAGSSPAVWEKLVGAQTIRRWQRRLSWSSDSVGLPRYTFFPGRPRPYP